MTFAADAPTMELRIMFVIVVGACHSTGTSAVLSRERAAAGGERWDDIQTLRAEGTIAGGGLTGTLRTTTDVRTGRSTLAYKLGPVDGAQGFDGTTGWQRDPGGEVTALDAPPAVRHARSQAWLDARGYLSPHRLPARIGAVTERTTDGRSYDVVVATPDGGDPVTLWFARDTHLLARVDRPDGTGTVTTTFDDYRAVDSIRVPFHAATDTTDAAGHTDPREHEDVRFERVWIEPALDERAFAAPTMTATARIDDPSGVATIPFELINNHIYVAANVDGGAARLLVDTGGTNHLTPAAASRLDITGAGKLSASGVGEQREEVAIGRGRELRVGTAVLTSPVFSIIDLGALDRVEGTPVDGVVGHEMFRRFVVMIDYARRELELIEPGHFTPPQGATRIPFQLDEGVPIVNGVLDGLPVRLSVDTGARGALTLHAPFVRAHDLVAKYRAAPEAVIGWGVGGASRGRPVRLGTLELGGIRIDGIAGELYTGDGGAFANTDHDGNLGGRLLRRFVVAFDYEKRVMYLAPDPAAAKTADPFDRSGLWLLAAGDAVEVGDVAPGSAAARAGIMPGDRILAIDNAPVRTRSLASWRDELAVRPVGTKLVLRIARGGAEQTLALELADRI